MLNVVISKIIKQINTEKTHKLQENGVYVFLFPKETRKDAIKNTIEKKYSVKVDFVNIVNLHRKIKNFRGTPGVMSQYKKAYVKLARGMKIEKEEDNSVKK